MRIALAEKLSAGGPDLKLMDEPTNYLDTKTILWLEDWLKNFKGRGAHHHARPRFHERDRAKDRGKRPGGAVTTFSGLRVSRNGKIGAAEAKRGAVQPPAKHALKKEHEFIARFKARARATRRRRVHLA